MSHHSRNFCGELVQLALVIGNTAVFAVLFYVLMGRAVRRQVASFDDESALDRVVRLVERGAAKNPRKVAQVMIDIRRDIARSREP
jgi:hypothetical protein